MDKQLKWRIGYVFVFFIGLATILISDSSDFVHIILAVDITILALMGIFKP